MTHQRLLELLRYEPDTGEFYWRVKTNRRIVQGSRAGAKHAAGYWTICIDGESFLAQRLAWFYMTGSLPTFHIDHRDTDGRNNRWLNLREVTQAVNNQNLRRPRIDNVLGIQGICRWGPRKFAARVQTGGKRITVGVFDSAAAASAAYWAAKKVLHDGCIGPLPKEKNDGTETDHADAAA